MIDLPAATLVAIGERELKTMQGEFAAAARRIAEHRPPLDVWRDVLEDHPRRGEVTAAAQKTVDELFAFIRARRLVDLPRGERIVVAAAPAYDLGLASMHSSPPLEPRPVKSYYCRDYEKAQGARFSLREFHERVMTNGIAPWWAHRQLLLPGDRGPVID